MQTDWKRHFKTFANEAQCGSLKRKGCADANFSVSLSLQTLKEYGETVFCIFVDLVKAYNTVNRDLLWKLLEIYGIPNKIINL